MRRFGLVAVFFAACTPVAAETHTPPITILRVGQLWPVRQLNPVLPSVGFEAEANYLIFDRLVWRGVDGKPLPGLLESWETSDEGRTLIFKLRPALQFHDGEPVTIDDLMFTFDAIRDPANDSSYAFDLQIIEAIEKLDERTASIRLRHRSTHFPELLDFGLLPAHLLRNRALAKDPFNQHPVGAGPFRVLKLENGVLEIERNPTYYGERPDPDRVRVTTFDSDGLWRRLLAGQIDVGLSIPWSKLRFLAQRKTVRIDESTRYYSAALCFNSTRKPFDHAEARRALAAAIDRTSLVERTELGFGTVTQRLNPEERAWTHFDISAAKRELGGRTIHMAVGAKDSDQIELAMNLQRQLSAADITLQIDPYPVIDMSVVKQSDMNFCGFLDFRPLELAAYKLGTALDPGYADIDAIFERIAQTQDEPTRRALFQQVEDRILEDAPFTVLFWQTHFSAYRAEYCGYHMTNLFDGLERLKPCR